MDRFRIVPTMRGFAALVGSARGLRRTLLPLPSEQQTRRAVRRAFPQAQEDPRFMPALAQHLADYFAGRVVEFFGVPLDWSGYTDFQIAVWQACSRIPYGQTCTYGVLAGQVGRAGAARAVGTALGRNPFPPIVPCHRVVCNDGTLGGYSGPGGTESKRRLLDMEARAVCRPARRSGAAFQGSRASA